ncbi:MAG: FKBP-type peptidyl-prolyl cis-trans isomerase [Actinomycetales bacterium]|nr:FKBP-type peptidyl-prolyl cis-trans isomerase [Actinomycetales bacterium]
MRSHAVRRLAALLTAAVAAATLAGCTAGGVGGCGEISSGSASELVTSTAKAGTDPKAEFPTPLISTGTQRSTMTAGEGDPIRPGEQVDFAYAVYSGADGTDFGAFGYGDGAPARASAGDDENQIFRALACTQVGGRYALTASVTDAFGASAATQLGLDADATIVVVLDVLDAFPGKSDGLNQLPLDGMPFVATAVDGTPGIMLPDAPKPTETRVETVKLGGGAVVEKGDTVALQYSLFIWPDSGDPRVVQSTWDAHRAADFTLEEGTVIPGFLTAVEGQKIGSQVLAVIPPADGYGDQGSQDGSIPGGATLVYVIDLLALRSSAN